MWDVLLKICNLLAIVPIWCNLTHSKIHQIYSLGILSCILFHMGYSTYKKITNTDFLIQSNVLYAIEIIFNIFISLTAATTTASSVFFKCGKLKNMLKKLENINKNLHTSPKPPQLWTVFCLLHILTLTTLVCDTILILNFAGTNILVCVYQGSKILIWYHVTVTNILVSTLAHDIKLKYTLLNDTLEKCWKRMTEQYKGVRYCKIQPHNRLKVSRNFETFRKFYDTLCDIVDDCSQIFGVTFLFFVLANITNIVYFTFAFIYFNTWEFWSVGLLWLTVSAVQVTTVAVTSESISQEAARTTNICYILLNDVPAVPKSYYHTLLKDELLQTAEQSYCRIPKMSAAGFFHVDLTMLGFILSSVTSYIIVAVESQISWVQKVIQ